MPKKLKVPFLILVSVLLVTAIIATSLFINSPGFKALFNSKAGNVPISYERKISLDSLMYTDEQRTFGAKSVTDNVFQIITCDNDFTKMWFIATAKNDAKFSYCNKDTIRTDDINCKGADFVRKNDANEHCIWLKEKQIQQTLNTSKMKDSGCNVHGNQESLDYPGGYDNKFGPQILNNSEYFDVTKSEYSLEDLDKLDVDVQAQINSYKTGTCPPNVKDPIYPYVPNMQYNISVFFNEMNPTLNSSIRTYVYQVSFWHSDNQYNQNKNKLAYADCGLKAGQGTFISGGGSIAAYGQNALTVGGNAITYKLDMLPGLKELIRKCNPSFNENYDLGRYRISSLFFTNEGSNTADIRTTTKNPKFTLKKKQLPVGQIKEGFNSFICNRVRGWTYDTKLPKDSSSFIHIYVAEPGKPLTQKYETGISASELNLISKVFTKDNGLHGFTYYIPAKYQDNVARDFYFYSINSDGSKNTLLTGYPVRVQCNSVKGFSDQAEFNSCSTIAGWAIDTKKPNTSLKVNVYYSQVKNGPKTYLETITADKFRGDLITVTNDNFLHGFQYKPKANLNDGKVKYFTFTAVDPTTNQEVEIYQSPTYTCRG